MKTLSLTDRLLFWLLRKLNKLIAYRNRPPKKTKDEIDAERREAKRIRRERAKVRKANTAHTYVCYLCRQSWRYVGMRTSNYCEKCRHLPKKHIGAKLEAHRLFDLLWNSGRMSRDEAYEYLSKIMELPKEFCHIGMFTKDQCLLLQVKLLQGEHSDLFQ